jgi:hypothetical protein
MCVGVTNPGLREIECFRVIGSQVLLNFFVRASAAEFGLDTVPLIRAPDREHSWLGVV